MEQNADGYDTRNGGSVGRMKKTAIAAGLTVGLLGGAAAGAIIGTSGVSGASGATIAQSESDDSTTTAPDTTAPDATAPEDAPEDAPPADAPDGGTFLEDTLAPLVEDGTITQAQADAVIEALKAARPERGPGGHGHGPRGHGPGMEAAATALGLSEEDLREQLRSGSTLAEIAAAQGVDVQTVIDALVAEAKAHLDEKVAAGDLTQEEADEKLADITERITDMVNNGGRRGPGGPPPGEDDAQGDAEDGSGEN